MDNFKVAVVVLTRGYSIISGYNDLIERNKSIYNVLYNSSKNKYDFIIFHEGNISIEDQLHISKFTPELKLIFKNVKNTKPKIAFNNNKNKNNYDLCPPTNLSNGFNLGYKHMCHFWAIDFLEYLTEYKYIIRIDEDCILTRFDKNTIGNMFNNNIKFISPYFQQQDEKDVIVGLEKLLDKFINENKIVPKSNFNDIKCPYTNFMIIDVEYFNNENNIKKFFNLVDESSCIYSNRWGDLPLWGAVLYTFLDSVLYLEDKTISYHHKSHGKFVN